MIKVNEIRDLFEFYQNWDELRPMLEALTRDPRLSEQERRLVGQLIELVDRVGPQARPKDG
ncbi:hypothetical protein [Palleronia caenipelagi]|uniref:hypothetical protein n=1 Tax=Palleronia caenipelagi TaxID=2489174 RepID=UPI00115DE017|nr:hypothetical protein [Palleronia caenipelagi]